MFIEPMLLQSVHEAFDDDRYIFEPKIDGHRLILSRIDGKVRLYTRHKTDCTNQYPELHNVPAPEGADLILDGEIAVFNQDGTNDFEAVMSRFKGAKGPVVNFVVFDILHFDGRDLRKMPLVERKEILASVLTPNPYFTLTASIDGRGIDFYDLIKQRNMEGIVAKKKDSSYVGRRSHSWLKIVNYQYHNVRIAGWRKGEFGWLIHIEDGSGSLKPAGILELAVPPLMKKSFFNVAKSIAI
ncbi:ATP-dependent DNA ligase [Marinicrinis lubricantis]|uniref:ATP-dependent DNA ligase n=1 Tax=Marinicrinis lubricantis TaxID=2086470 RepID=A0ABW1IMY6_9BACL